MTDREDDLAEIERILRAAAPPNAAMEGWRAVLLSPGIMASHVLIASLGPTWERPSRVEAELEELRVMIRTLRLRLGSLTPSLRTALNQEADPQFVRQRELSRSAIADEDQISELRDLLNNPTPKDQWVIIATERELERLEAACVPAIERTIRAGEVLEPSGDRGGRPPNWRARHVAYVIASYLMEATGRAPSLWTGQTPTGSFAMALTEIFKVLGIRSDIRRAGEWALSKLPSQA